MFQFVAYARVGVYVQVQIQVHVHPLSSYKLFASFATFFLTYFFTHQSCFLPRKGFNNDGLKSLDDYHFACFMFIDVFHLDHSTRFHLFLNGSF